MKNLKYVPVFRGRQQELIVLRSFEFGRSIYPCVEIIKELDRLPPKPKKNAKAPSKPKPSKKFEEVYLTLISKIKAEKILVDIPVHLKDTSSMKPETIDFLRTVAGIREVRTSYMNKLSSMSSRIIPVISTYFGRTNEVGSIKIQEADLRKNFPTLAFRTFQNSFSQDIDQIKAVTNKNDLVIMDWEDNELDEEDGDQVDIITELEKLSCKVIVHRNAIPKSLTNVSLVHCKVIDEVNNDLLTRYSDFAGSSFSDYCGIKKDGITKGGTVSPGFIYYDAVKNQFYGYKGEEKELVEYEKTIVPAVISSGASKRMHSDIVDYLGNENIGWKIIQNISSKKESGKSPGKFKRIGMEHYLHCIKSKIENKEFD